MTIAIKTLRKAIAFHDAVTKVLDNLRQRVDAKRTEVRNKLAAKVQKLVDAERALQNKVLSEPFDLRERLNKEHADLTTYFKHESGLILEQLRDIDSEANKAERAERLAAIDARIEELRKLIV